ncbi:UNVERIFIED_CONTAM: hypothetical protein NCL1_24874 [Trichonephila clavipes]
MLISLSTKGKSLNTKPDPKCVTLRSVIPRSTFVELKTLKLGYRIFIQNNRVYKISVQLNASKRDKKNLKFLPKSLKMKPTWLYL